MSMRGIFNHVRFPKSVLRRSLPKSVLRKSLIMFMVLIFLCLFFIKPFRNFILLPVWPKAWRRLDSVDVIDMMVLQPHRIPYVKALESCPFKVSTNISFQDARLTSASTSLQTRVQLKDESHRSFLPLLDKTVKQELLYLYLVMAEALNKKGIKHFFMGGSLLGAFRHRGFIPWDDDLDIAVSVMEWQRVRASLSCIHGFTLQIATKMHWRFYFKNRGFPFVDIFFFAQNESLGYAVPYYIIQYLAFSLNDMFPLSSAQFESVQVPVPANLEKVVKQIFDTDVCKSPKKDHKTGESLKVYRVPCSSLHYLFEMQT